MTEKNKQVIGFKNLVNSVRGRDIENLKRRNLKNVRGRFKQQQKKRGISEADIVNIANLLDIVLTALEEVDIGKKAYEAASTVAKNYKGGSGKSERQIMEDVDAMRDSLNGLFQSLDIDVRSTEQAVMDFYEENNIDSADMSSAQLTNKQLDDLNKIYKQQFKDIPAARTALSNFFSILPNLRGGNSWTYSNAKALKKGLGGYISNITGSFYEKAMYDTLEKFSKKRTFPNMEALETALVGAANDKADLLISYMSPSTDAEKIVKKVIGLSLKSYKLKKKTATMLHGTTRSAMLSDWRSGGIDSSKKTSAVIAMYNANQFLKVRKNNIHIDKEKYTKSFHLKEGEGEEERRKFQRRLSQIFKNTLYYNADIFFGKDIVFLIGRESYMSADEFIDRLLLTPDSLAASISGDNISIRAYLAAEGGK